MVSNHSKMNQPPCVHVRTQPFGRRNEGEENETGFWELTSPSSFHVSTVDPSSLVFPESRRNGFDKLDGGHLYQSRTLEDDGRRASLSLTRRQTIEMLTKAGKRRRDRAREVSMRGCVHFPTYLHNLCPLNTQEFGIPIWTVFHPTLQKTHWCSV